MDEDQWMYDSIMSEEVFDCRDDVLQWARSVAHENGFVAMIIRFNTNTGSRGRISFVLIGCERSGEYRCRKKEFVRRDIETRKCGCPFKLRGKLVVGGQGWMVKLMCGIHNHELTKSLVGHPYAGRLTKAEKTLIADMTKSMEHNANSCTTIKQIYNARSAYCSSIRRSDTEMQHLMKLLEWDQYIHWHKLKDEDVVRDIFWCHSDAVKLVNACNLRRLSFLDQGLSEPEVSIKEEMETISKRFEELDVCGNFTLNTKLREIPYPDQNSMCSPPTKVNTKGAPKKPMNRNPRSTKRDSSYKEYVDAFHSVQNSNSSMRHSASSFKQPNPRRIMPMLDQFQPFIHDFIDNIVDVKTDGNCGYRSVAGLLGMGEDSWSLARNHLLKELGKFSDDYIKLFGGTDKFEELRMSLLVDGLTKVTMDKWMDITDMGYAIASSYNVILASLSQQQSMTFFPLRSQPPADSSVHRIICIGHVYDNHFVKVYLKDRCPLPPVALLWSSNCHPQAKQWATPYISRMQHYKSFVISQPLADSSMHRIICIGHVYDNHFVQTVVLYPPVALLWSSNCHPQAKLWATPYTSRMQYYKSFMMFKRDYLIDKQYLDEIYYRHPFTDTGNHLHFQCMQLKNDDDVNTMLMCNHQFSCVGLIELLCTIGRTPDDILNLLEATMTPTHDALLYYNGRWNMPHQNEFVGYSFIGKNPKKFDIPSKCTMDELKDLIKQVVLHGIPPYGIHETQTVRRLFFRQPSHYEYLDKIIKFEIIELKTNADVLKVLVQSNYWKKFGPIEILAVFSKHVMEMEDDVSLSQN
ncbi:hypothetical protein HKD37_10G028063 [Glycine soja]